MQTMDRQSMTCDYQQITVDIIHNKYGQSNYKVQPLLTLWRLEKLHAKN